MTKNGEEVELFLRATACFQRDGANRLSAWLSFAGLRFSIGRSAEFDAFLRFILSRSASMRLITLVGAGCSGRFNGVASSLALYEFT